jgi:hypothetical protein
MKIDVKPTDKILLVRPNYPDGNSNNKQGNARLHHKYFPIGLLRMSTYFKKRGHQVDFIVGKTFAKFDVDVIIITTLFTYWRKFTEETIDYYSFLYPNARIVVGGIDASLNTDEYKSMGVEVFKGVWDEVDREMPDYSYFKDIDIKFQIEHLSRGCKRRCKPCGTYIVEPVYTFVPVQEALDRLFLNMVTYYDNSALFHPQIKEFLRRLSTHKVNGKFVNTVEFKSGFDARLLMRDYEDVMSNGGSIEDTLFYLLKKARVKSPRIAWDNWLEEMPIVEKSIELFEKVGYKKKELQVFMIYNFELTFEQMEFKRKVCQKLGVQISDCRYRPLNATFDNYDGSVPQTSYDYYIHTNWTDALVKEFRRNCRGQNILVRYLASGKPILIDYMSKNSVPDKVLNEYCMVYEWQKDSNSPIQKPIRESIA